MTATFQDLARVALIGVGATALMDLWLLLLQRLQVPTLNFAFIGRWVGHGLRGRWRHESIARAEPLPGERALGWATHYATGIAFAALLAVACGSAWLAHPRLGPALMLGIGTVAVPWFLMQPAMGAGVASSRTPTPWRNRLRSLATHAVFGAGLYLAAVALERISRA